MNWSILKRHSTIGPPPVSMTYGTERGLLRSRGQYQNLMGREFPAERVMQKIDELAGEITNLKMSLTDIEKRVSVVENSCAKVSSLDGEPSSQRFKAAQSLQT
ncbi:unnamed protein product [Ceratitis capitata]|uniref:(Mediterranean fruit fly) hypothetical protein n=1 Tax=Ceratitis capitata TaxID=7213 RepID=A0A811UTF0_CERCA|nr:unnamed protein product [Ceratitis capitata]